MPNGEMEFVFDGSDASDSAEALVDFLKQILPDWPARRHPTPNRRPQMRGDALDLITFLVTIPAAVLSGWNLAVRLQFKQKFEKLIAWAKERRTRGQRNPFVVLPPDNKVVPLDQVQPEQLLDAVAAQAQKPGSKS